MNENEPKGELSIEEFLAPKDGDKPWQKNLKGFALISWKLGVGAAIMHYAILFTDRVVDNHAEAEGLVKLVLTLLRDQIGNLPQ